MPCCGGGKGSPRTVRQQVVNRPSTKKKKRAAIHRVSRKPSTRNVEIKRQYVVPRQRCPKCGYPTMLVVIASRQRIQCANVNCKHIS